MVVAGRRAPTTSISFSRSCSRSSSMKITRMTTRPAVDSGPMAGLIHVGKFHKPRGSGCTTAVAVRPRGCGVVAISVLNLVERLLELLDRAVAHLANIPDLLSDVGAVSAADRPRSSENCEPRPQRATPSSANTRLTVTSTADVRPIQRWRAPTGRASMNVSSAARAIGISRSRAQDKTATTSTAPANVTHDCVLLPSFDIGSLAAQKGKATAVPAEGHVSQGGHSGQGPDGRIFPLTQSRGRVLQRPWAGTVVATWHPSSVLRAADDPGPCPGTVR